jgi:hypothetical protein
MMPSNALHPNRGVMELLLLLATRTLPLYNGVYEEEIDIPST